MSNGEDPCNELELDMLNDQLLLDRIERYREDVMEGLAEAEAELAYDYARCQQSPSLLCELELEMDLKKLSARQNDALQALMYLDDTNDYAKESMDAYIKCKCSHSKSGP